MLRASLAAVFLTTTALAGEWAYADGDIRATSPGAGWSLQTEVDGAPNIRAAFVKPRGPDRGSLLNFAIDGTPDLVSPAEYSKRTLATLGAPPYGFKVRKTGEFTWKGNAAARSEYTDAAGKRFWAQATIRTPRGGMLVVTLQSPDAPTYADDFKVFVAFLEGIDVAPRDPPKGSAPR